MGAYIKEHERYIIETMLKDGKKPKEIAGRIGKHFTTVYREIKRGTIEMRDGGTWLFKKVYCADVAQRKQEESGHNKGTDYKLANDYEFVREAERLIKDKKYSPYAALVAMEKQGLCRTRVCVTTFYNYIHSGLLYNISDSDLPYNKRDKKKNPEKRHCYHLTDAKKIEERPREADTREEYGHWEADTVYGGKGKSRNCLLVFTERRTRDELIYLIPDRSSKSVVKQFDKMESEYGTVFFRSFFKSITCDNGKEFSDFKGMERSVSESKPRTLVYFCHPFCSSERGSNENANKLIRRHIPKGADIGDYTKKEIFYIQEWINNYPRKMYNGLSVNEIKALEGIP